MTELPTWVSALPSDQRDGYEDGFKQGERHAAYVDAYGGDTNIPAVPDRFVGGAATRWTDGFSDGVEAHTNEVFESEHFGEMVAGELDRLELSGDERAVYAEVLTAEHESREISDACARVIGNWFHGGQRSAGYAFVSTGVIPDEGGATDLWRALGGRERDGQPEWMRTVLDAFGTYLVRRFNGGNAGPIEGWSSLWVRP